MQLNIEIEVQGCEQADINVTNQCETLTLEIIDAPTGGGVPIDDNAGIGDTDVTWSADKSSRELADKVDKVAGLGLSELSFTTADKNSLDQSEQDRHTHANKAVIDDLSDNAGALEYRGLPVSDQAALDAKVDKVAGYSLVADDEIAKLLTVEQDAQKNTVNSVAGKQGDVLLDKTNVGLGAVDNTADADKPISTAVADALAGKVDKVTGKVLSTHDLTDPLYDKLVGLEGTHWRGTFVSVVALEAGVTDPVAGDYADVDLSGEDAQRYIWDANDNKWVVQSGAVAPITAAQVKQLYESNPDTNAFTDGDGVKLSGIAIEATKNRDDSENADIVHKHDIVTITKAGFMSAEQAEMLTELELASISISGPRAVYTDRDYVYTINGLDSFTDYFIQVSEGTAVLDGDKINLRTPSLDTELILSLYAGSRRRDIVIDVSLSQYIVEPTPTPANFGDPLEGGFYSGMVWNRIALSSAPQTLGTGRVVFLVDQLGALVYEGQTLEVRSIANPFNQFKGTVAVASSGSIALDVTSVQGSGTYSDWAVMSRFRNIIAPKAQGESVPIALKFENTDMPIATQTLTEGWEATNAMLAAGTAAQYPAAHWARALVINGYSDWYIPARDELELAWRNLKPVTTDNYIGARYNSLISYKQSGAYPDATAAQGANLNSSPQSPAYTLTDPAQTSSAAFRAGGSEEFAWNNYFWTSSEASAAVAWHQYWGALYPGGQGDSPKLAPRRIRAVRRSII